MKTVVSGGRDGIRWLVCVKLVSEMEEETG